MEFGKVLKALKQLDMVQHGLIQMERELKTLVMVQLSLILTKSKLDGEKPQNL
jgi:hypothetical protein